MILGSSSFTWKSVRITLLTVPVALFFPLENDTSQSDQPDCFAVSMIPVCWLNQEETISTNYFSTFHPVDTLYLTVNCRS